MSDPEAVRRKMKELGCCVIIPTYNNAGTLEKVIRDVLEYTDSIIVVNDGSTDTTSEILSPVTSHQSPVTVITSPKNSGKGYALRQGFHFAIQQGYRYAITIDSDGQHFPEDIPKFIEGI
ncbi:MAG: glycosyltransferase family 2 protein, partial [bacterium]